MSQTGPDYVMVPREPTSEMHEAAFKHSLSAAEGDAMNAHFVEINAKIYRAMLSAAPRFPSGEDSDDVAFAHEVLAERFGENWHQVIAPPSPRSGSAVAYQLRLLGPDGRPVPTCHWVSCEKREFDHVRATGEIGGGLAEARPLYASPRSDDGSGLTPSRLEDRSAAAAGKSREDKLIEAWNADRQRFFEARDALYQFKYPPDPKLLREIADEIDCGNDCAHGNIEWDTNAYVCSRSDSKEGCASEKASCLRQFADALDVRSRLQPAAASEGASPEAVNQAIAQERDVGEPVAWQGRWVGQSCTSEWSHIDNGSWRHMVEAHKNDDIKFEVRPLYLHPTTSPSAIGEAPTSADAVTKSVKRLNDMADAAMYTKDSPYEGDSPFGEQIRAAASLLIALDAERGRLREALIEAEALTAATPIAGLSDSYRARINYIARSALPASDEGTTNE